MGLPGDELQRLGARLQNLSSVGLIAFEERAKAWLRQHRPQTIEVYHSRHTCLGLRLPIAELDFGLTTLDDAEPPRWQRGRRRGHDGFRFRMFRFCERYRMCVAYAQPAKSRARVPGISLWHFDPASRTASTVPHASAARQ